MTKLQEFQKLVRENIHAGQRVGQANMNALEQINPELYQHIHRGEADCFYDDNKVYLFNEIVYHQLQEPTWEMAD